MRTRIRSVALPAILLALLTIAATACSKDSGKVGVTEKDFSITLDSSSADAGEVTFEVTNDGPSTHEFVVFRTDLAAADLPTADDGTVDEEGQGVEAIDEIEDITNGSTQSLTVNLDAGKYVVICNLPGHYAQGMHASFTAS